MTCVFTFRGALQPCGEGTGTGLASRTLSAPKLGTKVKMVLLCTRRNWCRGIFGAVVAEVHRVSYLGDCFGGRW